MYPRLRGSPPAVRRNVSASQPSRESTGHRPSQRRPAETAPQAKTLKRRPTRESTTAMLKPRRQPRTAPAAHGISHHRGPRNFRAVRATRESPQQIPRSRNQRASRQAGTPHPPRPPPGGTHNQCLVPEHAGTNNPHRRQCPSARAHGDQPSPPEPVYTKSNLVPAPAGINPRVCIGNSISHRRGDQPRSTQ